MLTLCPILRNLRKISDRTLMIPGKRPKRVLEDKCPRRRMKVMDQKLQDRIREAVGVIGRFLSENQINFDEQNLQYELENMGFSEKEIAGAYTFIEESTLGPKWRKKL